MKFPVKSVQNLHFSNLFIRNATRERFQQYDSLKIRELKSDTAVFTKHGATETQFGNMQMQFSDRHKQ